MLYMMYKDEYGYREYRQVFSNRMMEHYRFYGWNVAYKINVFAKIGILIPNRSI